jgi:ABC-type nitrate/sulfonate/bicarbonate transport system ATPase subunit
MACILLLDEPVGSLDLKTKDAGGDTLFDLKRAAT